MDSSPLEPRRQPSATATARATHGAPLRGIDAVTGSFSTAGRFGRMFRNIPVLKHDHRELAALAATMISPVDPHDMAPVVQPAAFDERENALIPAGYTYFGQFLDHDISFDPASSLQRQNDPDSLEDFRTPRFDLDSMYGRGPADQPYLYRNGSSVDPHPTLGFDRRGVMLLEGENRADPQDPLVSRFAGPDLPRNSESRALIGDPRNDENLIVSQLQVLFLKFHNRMVERVFSETGLTGDDLFKEAQRLVRWHYQWIVIHDFLPRIVDGNSGDGLGSQEGIFGDILRNEAYAVPGGGRVNLGRPNMRFFRWHALPFMPVEFSVGAYRFGHSMVRAAYFINDFVKGQMNDTRIPIFSSSAAPHANLNGFRRLPDLWGIQWKYFFNLDASSPPQPSYKIDTNLSAPLSSLPANPDMPNLAHRNLLRGYRLMVPSGQRVARAMGMDPISDSDLGLSARGAPDFEGDAPLWFYVLREAELLAGGQHLGPVGGRICAEVLIGLLVGDPLSWLNVEPSWQPPLAEGGRFTMPELIRFAETSDNSSPAARDHLAQWRDNLGSPSA
jgi:hypothetical protein